MKQQAKMHCKHGLFCILNCITGERATVDNATFVIGSGEHADFLLTSAQCPKVLCKVEKSGYAMELQFSRPVLINGTEATFFRSMPGEEHTVAGAGHLLAFKHTTQPDAWMALGNDN